MDGLLDKRLDRASHRLVPVDEAMRLLEQYQSRHYGWNVSHFHRFYKREGGVRSHTHGLFCSLYTDRGSHYWHTPEARGKVDKHNPTQFGRPLAQLGAL